MQQKKNLSSLSAFLAPWSIPTLPSYLPASLPVPWWQLVISHGSYFSIWVTYWSSEVFKRKIELLSIGSPANWGFGEVPPSEGLDFLEVFSGPFTVWKIHFSSKGLIEHFSSLLELTLTHQRKSHVCNKPMQEKLCCIVAAHTMACNQPAMTCLGTMIFFNHKNILKLKSGPFWIGEVNCWSRSFTTTEWISSHRLGSWRYSNLRWPYMLHWTICKCMVQQNT